MLMLLFISRLQSLLLQTFEMVVVTDSHLYSLTHAIDTIIIPGKLTYKNYPVRVEYSDLSRGIGDTGAVGGFTKRIREKVFFGQICKIRPFC